MEGGKEEGSEGDDELVELQAHKAAAKEAWILGYGWVGGRKWCRDRVLTWC